MIKTIPRHFSHVCTQRYQSLGFTKSKVTFARIKGDVIQAFTLRYFRDRPTCSVEFGVFPLCLPQPIVLEAGGYELDEFLFDPQKGRSGWTFDAASDESVITCVESMCQTLDLHLIPFFERCDDCKAALPAMIELEELFESNRQKYLSLLGEADCAVPWQERSLFDYRKYYMALKTHNLPYAQQFLNYQINYYEKRLKSFAEPDAPKQPDAVIEGFSIRLGVYEQQRNWLDSGDFSRFDEHLRANEKAMYEFLAARYPKVHGNL